MKNVFITVLTILMTITPMKKTEAAVAAVSGVGAIAIAGLAAPVVGATYMVSQTTGPAGGFIALVYGAGIGGLVGLVLLDEDTGELSFDEISFEAGEKLSLSKNEVEIYNSEVYEANILLEEVSVSLDSNSSVEESRDVWNEMSEFVSKETFKVMQVLAAQK